MRGRVEAHRDRVGIALVVQRPLAHDLRHDLGVELHAPGASRRAGTPAGRRRCAPARPRPRAARTRRSATRRRGSAPAAPPSSGSRAPSARATSNQPISGDGLRADSAPAGDRQQLRAEADAEHRHARLQRVAQQLDLRAHPRQPVGVADVHAAAEDHERVELRRAGPGIGSPAPGDPLDQLVAAGVAALGEQAARATAGMPDTEDSHPALSLAGCTALHEGQLLLFTGLLLAAGLAASLAAGRLRLPGLVLVLGLGMLIGSDGLGWIDVRRLRARAPGGHRRRRADPVRGRPVQRLRGDPARCWRRRSILATLGTLAHRGADRGRGGADPRPRAAAGAAARLDRGRHRRRGRVRGAARLDAAAAAGAHARGRVGPQRPDRDPARDRLHRGDPGARLTASLDALLLAVEELGDRARRRARRSAAWRSLGLQQRAAALRRPVPGRLDRDGRARLRRSPTRCTAPGFLAVYLAGLVLGTATTPARRTIVTFHDGVAWIAQLALFLILGLLVFPEDLGDDRARGHRDRARHRRASPGRWRRSS